MRVALVNCVALPEPDPDERPLLDALRAAGHEAQTIAWDDPDADPAAFDVCVIRATWNYHRQPDRFARWIDETARRTRLLNSAEVVRWNTHKRYLCALEFRRIPVVPTLWRDKGSAGDMVAEARGRGWERVVVKPSVSGGSRDTRVFDLGSQEHDARAFLIDLSAREDAMVQRYLPSVEHGGEVSLVWIGGELSHAIEKRPRFAGQDEQIVPHPAITQEERRFAAAVLDACPFEPVYARVDVMRLDDGGIVLSELELIEPSLFFQHGPGSPERMVRAVERACAAGV